MTIRTKIIITFLLTLQTIIVFGQSSKETVKGNSAFSFELFKNVFVEDKNTFFSPYSISSALAMTYAGARTETERQMSKVLHYDLNQLNTHQGFFELNSLIGNLSNDSTIKLSIANALWKDEHWWFKQDYLDLTKRYYDASIFQLSGAKPINDWAYNKTNGKIKEIVKDDDLKNTHLVLTNAIYFKGDWITIFDTNNTKKEKFRTINGSSTDVDMMNQCNTVNYFEDEYNQILELPYKGESVSMIIILPKEKSSIKNLVSSLDSKQFSFYNSQLKKQEVKIFIPKFSFASEYRLKKVLPQMGMPDAFDPIKADFTGMSGGLSIGEVIHKAFIEVNEKGSEAAAVTVVTMVEKSARKEIIFKADRPFMFFISDKQTESILFMGCILNPNG
jgi:serpin B